MDYPSVEELRWVREKEGWGVSLKGEEGKVSDISGNATYHGEAYSLPFMSNFGVPRTDHHSIWLFLKRWRQTGQG